MSVDTATVKRIASLARIAITEEDAAKMAPELDNILHWIEMLGEVDTAGVEPMTASSPTAAFASRCWPMRRSPSTASSRFRK
jgi:aspartyl-tRNA(Asn)/glutamyl-tRNA(Gln) amidotransferase subunit C